MTGRPLLTGRESATGGTLGETSRRFELPGNGRNVGKLPPCQLCKRPSVLYVYGVPQCLVHLSEPVRQLLLAAIAKGRVGWR